MMVGFTGEIKDFIISYFLYNDQVKTFHWMIPLLIFPFTVGKKIGVVADELSVLPGIEKDDRYIFGLCTLVIVGIVVVIFTSGALATLGADIPLIGDGDNSTSTSQESPEVTPSSMETPTASTPTPTVQPTSTATRTSSQLSDLERFELVYRDYLQRSVQNETLTNVPVLAMQYRERNTELWIVYWECDNGSDVVHQRFNVISGFMYAAGHSEGDKPDQLKMYGVSNLKSYNDSISYIPTSSAEKAFNKSMNRDMLLRNSAERMRVPTESESDIAFKMVVNESGRSKAEQAFNEHYPLEKSNGGCPAGVEPASAD